MSRGLHAAHELTSHDGKPLHLVHRDISPQNVLIGFDGVVRLTDFGIAKALGHDAETTTGILKGKLGYMAPEQLRFERPDRRTDLYALGVVLFELLSGRRLYSGGAESETPHLILHGPVPDISEERRDVPDSLVGLLFDLLAKEREHRPLDAREVADRIGAIMEEMGEPPESIEAFLEARFSRIRDQMRAKTALALAAVQEGRDPTAAVAHADEDDRAVAPAQVVRPSGRSRSRFGLTVALAAMVAVAVGVGAGVWYVLEGSGEESAAVEASEEAEVPPANETTSSETEGSPVDESADEYVQGSSGSLPPGEPEPRTADAAPNLSSGSSVSGTADESESEPTSDSESASRRRSRRSNRRRGGAASMMDCPPGWWCPQ
jgi:serine/threonine-protein kinase